jgi:hypothetical protein
MDVDHLVTAKILSDRNATVAEVTYEDPEANWFDDLTVATGSSKREPGDLYDARIATDLALGRALEKLGKSLRKRAEKAVKAACPEPEHSGEWVIYDELQPFLEAADIQPEPWQKRILSKLFRNR